MYIYINNVTFFLYEKKTLLVCIYNCKLVLFPHSNAITFIELGKIKSLTWFIAEVVGTRDCDFLR